VPGVGKVLSSTLLAQLPELGMLSRKQMPHWLVSHHLTATVEIARQSLYLGRPRPGPQGAVYGNRGGSSQQSHHQNFLSAAAHQRQACQART